MGRAARICGRSGCPEIVVGDTYCADHKFKAWEGSKRAEAKPPGWQRTRQWVLRRDNNICQYCGGTANEIDHVQPVTMGGSHHTSNLVAACTSCNKQKNYAERVGNTWTPPNLL